MTCSYNKYGINAVVLVSLYYLLLLETTVFSHRYYQMLYRAELLCELLVFLFPWLSFF